MNDLMLENLNELLTDLPLYGQTMINGYVVRRTPGGFQVDGIPMLRIEAIDYLSTRKADREEE